MHARRFHPIWVFCCLTYILLFTCRTFLPPAVCFLLSVTCFLALPGFAALCFLPPRFRGDVLEHIVLSVVSSSFLFCVLCLVWVARGAGVESLEKTYLGLGIALAGIQYVRRQEFDSSVSRRVDGRRVTVVLLVVIAAMGVLLGFTQGKVDYDLDSLDHLAFIGEIVRSGEIQPLSVFYRGADGVGIDARKGFLHTLYAMACSRAGLEPITWWFWFPIFAGPFVGLTFYLFCRELIGPVAAAVLSVVVLFLFYPGDGPLWFNNVTIPGRFAMGFVWYGLACFIRFLAGGSRIPRAGFRTMSPAPASTPVIP